MPYVTLGEKNKLESQAIEVNILVIRIIASLIFYDGRSWPSIVVITKQWFSVMLCSYQQMVNTHLVLWVRGSPMGGVDGGPGGNQWEGLHHLRRHHKANTL